MIVWKRKVVILIKVIYHRTENTMQHTTRFSLRYLSRVIACILSITTYPKLRVLQCVISTQYISGSMSLNPLGTCDSLN